MNVLEKIQKAIPTLNKTQIEAITSTDGPVLIIAGPGTGKTLTIVTRTLYLLLTGKAEPEEIILTTFTEKAAFELRDRISQLAKKLEYNNNLNQLKVGTIHSLCNDFILKFLPYTPLKKGYTVLDDLTQLFFINEHFKELVSQTNGKFFDKWTSKWETIQNIVTYFNKITEELIDTNNLVNSNLSDFIKSIFECYQKYQKKLFEMNKVDFAHLQRILFDLLQDKGIYPKIKKKIKYILVDEYQDTNYIQEQILLKLAHPENNLCVVGDEDQALYRFRGATVRNILQFPQHFNSCKQIKLTTNYRSHKVIIENYNKFITSIEWGKYRYPKQIEPDLENNFPNYPAVFCIWGQDPQDEAERFVNFLKFLKENNIIQDWADVALLLKSLRKEHSEHYIKALEKHKIPYFAPRAKGFFENIEIKLLIACYSIILGFYENLDDYFYKDYIEDAIKLLGEEISKNITLKNYLREKANEILNLKEGALDLNILDYFYQLCAYKPFSSFLEDKTKVYNLSIFSKLLAIFQDYYNISVVSAKNKEYIKLSLFGSFFNFLIKSGVDEYEDPDNPIPKGFVQIMTIHQSKGLEFPVVIVGSLDKSFRVQYQVDKELLPFSKRGIFEDPTQIVKFDRLRHYYVAFSRAQKILVLTTHKTPQSWFSPIWEGLNQYPYIAKKLLQVQRFASKAPYIPKKSFSISQINVYETCPKQYQFYKLYEFQPSRSAQILIGTLVHHTIEDIHRAVLDGKKIYLEDIQIWFEQNYKALLLKGLRPIGEIAKQSALNHVINYFNQNTDLLEKIKETEVDVSVEKDDYIITGKIDLLISQNGKLELLDFKTQPKPLSKSPLIDKYFKQLCLYAYIIKERYNQSVENIYIYWLAENDRKNALMELVYSEKEVNEAGKYFDEVVKNIRENRFTLTNTPDTQKVCKECDFKFYCFENGIIEEKDCHS